MKTDYSIRQRLARALKLVQPIARTGIPQIAAGSETAVNRQHLALGDKGVAWDKSVALTNLRSSNEFSATKALGMRQLQAVQSLARELRLPHENLY